MGRRSGKPVMVECQACDMPVEKTAVIDGVCMDCVESFDRMWGCRSCGFYDTLAGFPFDGWPPLCPSCGGADVRPESPAPNKAS